MAENASGVETARRTYSDEEIDLIYELARFHLENGEVKKAEVIVFGLLEIAPQYPCAWLAQSYIHLANKNFEAAAQTARQALKLDTDFVEAMLFLIACLLTLRDYNSAGTYLGEINDKIESGAIDHPYYIRFFKTQLARYNARQSLAH